MTMFVLLGHYDAKSELLGVFSTKQLAVDKATEMEQNDQIDVGMWTVFTTDLNSGMCDIV